MKMKIPAKPGCFPAQMVLMAITIPFLSLTGRGAEGDTWVRKADMPTPRQVNTVAVNGKIYAIGGAVIGGSAASSAGSWRFTLLTQTSSRSTNVSAPTPLRANASTVHDPTPPSPTTSTCAAPSRSSPALP